MRYNNKRFLLFWIGPSTPIIATIKIETPSSFSIEIANPQENITDYKVDMTGNTTESVSFSTCEEPSTSCTFKRNVSNRVEVANLKPGTYYSISFFTLYGNLESLNPQILSTYTSKRLCFIVFHQVTWQSKLRHYLSSFLLFKIHELSRTLYCKHMHQWYSMITGNKRL